MKTISLPVSGKNISKVEFQVHPETADFLIGWLTDWLEVYVSSGVSFADDQTFQFGWSILKIKVEGDTLKLLSPNFTTMPIEYSPNLTQALYFFMEHKYVGESYKLGLGECHMLETAIVGKGVDEFPTFLRRYNPGELHKGDSGWFFGALSDDVDNEDPESLSMMTLYELTMRYPHVRKFLFLPPSCEVFDTTGEFEIYFTGSQLTPEAGSYVEQKYKQNQLEQEPPKARKGFSFKKLFGIKG